MFNIFLLSILATLIFSPIGILVNKKELSVKINYENLSRILIYSLIIVSFISLTLNFFVPLNKSINTIFLIIPLLVFIYHKNFFFNFRFLKFAILIALIVFLLITKSNTYRPDAGLYHLPFISILNNEKIIFGLSNFHFRFGHISIVQYTSAIFNNHIFLTNGIVLPVALLYASVIINFLSQIKDYIISKNISFHLIFLVATSIYILGKMNRYSEFGNDTPTHILFLFLISEILKNNFNHNFSRIRNFFLLSIFITMNKIFFILSIFLPLLFLKKNFFKVVLNGKIFFILLFFILWTIKNIIISGCIFYPIKTTCISKLPWVNIYEAKIVSDESEAWAKSWPGHDSSKGAISHSDFNKEFYWLNTWIKNNGFKSFKIITTYLLILITFSLLTYKNKNNLNNFSKLNIKNIKLMILFLIVATLIWFLKAPDYRYGTGYIVSLIALIFSLITYKNLNKNFSKFSIIFIAISFSIFLIKNSKRIIIDNVNYINSPWPKYYSHSDDNIYKKPQKMIINGKNLYFSRKNLCMYGLAPCSGIKNKFKIIEKSNYIFFVIK